MDKKIFLKENWFKISIIIIILLVGLSVVYYLLVYIPKKESATLDIQKQQLSAQQAQWEQEQAAKQSADQKAAEEKAQADQEAASQKVAELKTEQAKQAAADKTAAENKKNLENCLLVFNLAKEYGVKHNTWNSAAEQTYQDGIDQCYHKYPQN